MSLSDILKQAISYNFDQGERHLVADVFRTADSEYRSRHPVNLDSKDRVARAAYELSVEHHAEAVARQYMHEEIDKWHRRGYKSQADGVSHE